MVSRHRALIFVAYSFVNFISDLQHHFNHFSRIVMIDIFSYQFHCIDLMLISCVSNDQILIEPHVCVLIIMFFPCTRLNLNMEKGCSMPTKMNSMNGCTYRQSYIFINTCMAPERGNTE